MRRPFFLIPLLAFGTIAGFAHGFHSLHHGGCHRWDDGYAREGNFAPPAAPVIVNAPAAAPAPVAAPAPAQTLVIPIIVNGQSQPAAAAQPTTYLIQLPSQPQAANAAPQAVTVTPVAAPTVK